MRRYMAALDACFESLVDDVNLGRPFRELGEGLLRIEQGRHVVLFMRRVKAAKAVVIVRVLHDRMLPRLHLDPTE